MLLLLSTTKDALVDNARINSYYQEQYGCNAWVESIYISIIEHEPYAHGLVDEVKRKLAGTISDAFFPVKFKVAVQFSYELL